MMIRLLGGLLALSLVLAGCHDAAAELLHGSASTGDACCSDGAEESVLGDGVLTDAASGGGCCAGCADDPACACDAECTNCADCPACGDCGECPECAECCADAAADTAKQELEALAPAGVDDEG